jgi:hypothetical protein
MFGSGSGMSKMVGSGTGTKHLGSATLHCTGIEKLFLNNIIRYTGKPKFCDLNADKIVKTSKHEQ